MIASKCSQPSKYRCNVPRKIRDRIMANASRAIARDMPPAAMATSSVPMTPAPL
jgi:hypothetical protein